MKFPDGFKRHQWAVGNGNIFYHSEQKDDPILMLPRKGEVMPLVGALCLHNGGKGGIPTLPDARNLVKRNLKIAIASFDKLFTKLPPATLPLAAAPETPARARTASIANTTNKDGVSSIIAGDGSSITLNYTQATERKELFPTSEGTTGPSKGETKAVEATTMVSYSDDFSTLLTIAFNSPTCKPDQDCRWRREEYRRGDDNGKLL